MTAITKITDEILKISKSLGQTVEMLTDEGDSTVDVENAKYLYLKPLYLFIALPIDEKSTDIICYLGKQRNEVKCNTLISRIKTMAHFNGYGWVTRNRNEKIIKPKHFADEARVAKERAAKER